MLNGVLGPPKRLRPVSTSAPTSRMLAAAPSSFMSRLRCPDGSVKTGPE
jgi:hypothetical protein